MNPFLIFIIIFFSGDESMFLFSFFSATGSPNIILLFLIAILSNLSSDILLYSVFSSFGNKIIKRSKRLKKYKKLTESLFKKTKNQALALFLSKFIYGTRVLTVISLGVRKMKFSNFILFDLLALIPITTTILLLGWFAGKGADYFHIYKPILFIFPLILILIFRKWLNKTLQQSYLLIKNQKE